MMSVAHTPELLSSYLKTLRLPAMLRECDAIARQAAQQSATYELFLQQLTELEVQQQQSASIGRRLKLAGFPVVKELSEFDFAAAPKLNKKRLLDLAQCRFIDQRSNLVLNDAPSTGKTHLAIALGREACRPGIQGALPHRIASGEPVSGSEGGAAGAAIGTTDSKLRSNRGG